MSLFIFTTYGVTYLYVKSFKTWNLAKFKNKISILISLTFGLRIKSKEMPTYASRRKEERRLDFSKGEGGVTWCNTQGTLHSYILMLTHINTIDRKYLIQKTFSTKRAFKWLRKNWVQEGWDIVIQHYFTMNFRNLAFTLVYQFSNVLSEKRKRDTSPKEAGGGGGGGSQAS